MENYDKEIYNAEIDLKISALDYKYNKALLISARLFKWWDGGTNRNLIASRQAEIINDIRKKIHEQRIFLYSTKI